MIRRLGLSRRHPFASFVADAAAAAAAAVAVPSKLHLLVDEWRSVDWLGELRNLIRMSSSKRQTLAGADAGAGTCRTRREEKDYLIRLALPGQDVHGKSARDSGACRKNILRNQRAPSGRCSRLITDGKRYLYIRNRAASVRCRYDVGSWWHGY